MKERVSIPLTVFRPHMRHELGFLRTWLVMTRNIWGARELVWQLFKRDFLAGYKKSFVGVLWIIAAPFVGIVSWVFLQRAGMLKPGDVGVPYPVYVLTGCSMWGVFMGLFKNAGETLQAGAGLLMQVKYPHEALLFKQIAQQLATFTITVVMNVIAMLVFGVIPSPGLLLLPLVILPMILLAAAGGLVLSMISVVAMDVNLGINMSIGLLLYATPVIYVADQTPPFVQHLVRWNPLTYLVCSCRDIMLYGRLYHPLGYVVASALAVLAFLLSWRLFYVSEDRVIERMV